jgi:hypothetical protein
MEFEETNLNRLTFVFFIGLQSRCKQVLGLHPCDSGLQIKTAENYRMFYFLTKMVSTLSGQLKYNKR